MSHIINFFVCNHEEFPYDYRQKIDNVTQLQIIDDKKQITEKKSVISACNVDYRLKRSGPIVRQGPVVAAYVISKHFYIIPGFYSTRSPLLTSVRVN